MVERQDERQCYHRSSVISGCDGAEPLLACSVPEKCDNSVQGTDLRYTFLKEKKNNQPYFDSPYLKFDSFSFQLNCSDFEVYS